ncbi:efflux RND transporter periplasmic adaptor subunit [Pararoseomonas indoligenes]|uniref:Efflux RND transporter periplasmic adaptor subunit n=1 Tax=Roseomonas indoligenes TaxID=2820811 RepID=A0A940S6F0_9PROT|nr:efflux RND transporter periplasmic adaptor subunit [Pararoseomonas indoligenes]MBP0493964.1 efflux RND transporter periplasmic adaptor subunit [Pararoseomonas indoligenes]
MPDHNLINPETAAPAMLGRAPARRGRWVLGALALLAVGGAVLMRGEIAAGLHRPAPAVATVPVEPPPALTVAVAAATPRALARSVVGDGSVVPWQELVIGAEAGGLRVVEVAVDEGDAVRAGQPLIRMDETLLRAVLGQAEAAVTEAQAALRNARQDLARAADLSRSGNAPRQTLELREAAALQAEARVASAVARQGEVAARLAQARILAPTDGIVSRRSALPGNVTSAGQEMLRLIRDGRIELDARVPELELAAVRPGQPVRVTHGDRVVTGTVRAVAPTVLAETRLGIVHVALPADSGLRPGMFARAEIQPGEAQGLTVPQSALLFREGRPAVLVVSDDRVALRPITTGRRGEGVVEVTSGLAEGERVVATGAGFLSDGDRVRVAVQ